MAQPNGQAKMNLSVDSTIKSKIFCCIYSNTQEANNNAESPRSIHQTIEKEGQVMKQIIEVENLDFEKNLNTLLSEDKSNLPNGKITAPSL